MVQSFPKDFRVIRVVIKFPDIKISDVQSAFGITAITDLSTVWHLEKATRKGGQGLTHMEVREKMPFSVTERSMAS
jgi:hypothetical protein